MATLAETGSAASRAVNKVASKTHLRWRTATTSVEFCDLVAMDRLIRAAAPEVDLATWSVALEKGRGRLSWGQANLPMAAQLIDPQQVRYCPRCEQAFRAWLTAQWGLPF